MTTPPQSPSKEGDPVESNSSSENGGSGKTTSPQLPPQTPGKTTSYLESKIETIVIPLLTRMKDYLKRNCIAQDELATLMKASTSSIEAMSEAPGQSHRFPNLPKDLKPQSKTSQIQHADDHDETLSHCILNINHKQQNITDSSRNRDNTIDSDDRHANQHSV